MLSKLSVARPICLRLLMHCARRAASRADCTAGKSSEIKHRDDRDHHQQFDQRESGLSLGVCLD